MTGPFAASSKWLRRLGQVEAWNLGGRPTWVASLCGPGKASTCSGAKTLVFMRVVGQGETRDGGRTHGSAESRSVGGWIEETIENSCLGVGYKPSADHSEAQRFGEGEEEGEKERAEDLPLCALSPWGFA